MKISPLFLPTPFTIGSTNAFLLESEKEAIFIDTGINIADNIQQVRNSLEELRGKNISLSKILLTHAHVDHFGLANWLQQQTGAPVYVHSSDLTKAVNPDELFIPEINHLNLFGVPASLVPECLEAWHTRLCYAEPLVSARPLYGGEKLAFGSSSLEVVSTPGHSMGSCCYYLPEEKTLFSGDSVLKKTTSLPLMRFLNERRDRFPGLTSYVASLKLINQLQVDTIYPGHGRPFHNNLNFRVQQILQQVEARSQQILDALQGTSLNPFQLAGKLFAHRLQGFDIFLKMSEVTAHLDRLNEQGRVIMDTRRGVPYYVAISQ